MEHGCADDASCDDGDADTSDVCVDGVCHHTTRSVTETCNGTDDDGDGAVDEGAWRFGGPVYLSDVFVGDTRYLIPEIIRPSGHETTENGFLIVAREHRGRWGDETQEFVHVIRVSSDSRILSDWVSEPVASDWSVQPYDALAWDGGYAVTWAERLSVRNGPAPASETVMLRLVVLEADGITVRWRQDEAVEAELLETPYQLLVTDIGQLHVLATVSPVDERAASRIRERTYSDRGEILEEHDLGVELTSSGFRVVMTWWNVLVGYWRNVEPRGWRPEFVIAAISDDWTTISEPHSIWFSIAEDARPAAIDDMIAVGSPWGDRVLLTAYSSAPWPDSGVYDYRVATLDEDGRMETPFAHWPMFPQTAVENSVASVYWDDFLARGDADGNIYEVVRFPVPFYGWPIIAGEGLFGRHSFGLTGVTMEEGGIQRAVFVPYFCR